jgi:hypothetical protein
VPTVCLQTPAQKLIPVLPAQALRLRSTRRDSVAILGFSHHWAIAMLLIRPRHKLSSLLLALGLLAMVGPASATTYVYRTMIAGGHPPPPCIPGSLTESTVNASLSIQVPAQGCNTITVTLNGAAGGNGADGGIGGSGGAITFQLPAATDAGNWTGVVGQGGFGQTTTYQGGAGGGYTSVSFNGVLVGTAGGGGGAGDAENGGDGGMTATNGASNTTGSVGGVGATDSGPGASGALINGYNSGGGASDPGAGMAGGYAQGPSTGAGGAGVGDGGIFQDDGTSGNGAGGGGGGGYFGGGGGTQGGDSQSGGGGGGGSDFAISSASGVTDTVGGGAPAGTSTGATGNNGSITISWQ